jgi:hypothetical protein
MAKFRKPKGFRQSKGDRDWVARDSQMAVLAAILIVFVAAGSLSDGRIIPDFSTAEAPRKAKVPAPGDELKTGSVFITPPDGDICEHRLIDNATWRIYPNGHVTCDVVVSRAGRPEDSRDSSRRIEAIRDGFFQKRP